MQKTLFRLAGTAAIAGGGLRIADIFAARGLDPQALALIYLVTDILLLLGLTGWYAARAGGLGWSGAAGYAISVCGILVIRSAAIFPGFGYALGAALFLIGLVLVSLRDFWQPARASLPAWLWLLALLCAPAAAAGAPLAGAAAALFAAGFVCAGLGLLRR